MDQEHPLHTIFSDLIKRNHFPAHWWSKNFSGHSPSPSSLSSSSCTINPVGAVSSFVDYMYVVRNMIRTQLNPRRRQSTTICHASVPRLEKIIYCRLFLESRNWFQLSYFSEFPHLITLYWGACNTSRLAEDDKMLWKYVFQWKWTWLQFAFLFLAHSTMNSMDFATIWQKFLKRKINAWKLFEWKNKTRNV